MFKIGQDTIPIGYGLGTKWYKKSSELNNEITTSLIEAVKTGFTHIDLAEVYGNYPEFKAALPEILKIVTREKLIITDKFNPAIKDTDHTPLKHAKETLAYLGLEYVDLYLIHSPFVADHLTIESAWDECKTLKKEGLAKHIGVSNFAVKDLEKIDEVEANQIEFSPFLQAQTPDIVQYCQKANILVEAYSSQTPVIQKDVNPELTAYLTQLSEKYGKSEGQVNLRWVFDQGVLPVTTTNKVDRMKEYLDLDFKLTDEEIKKINELGSKTHVRKYWTDYYN